MFVDHLIEKIKKMDNPTVMGLDPKLEYIPKSVKTSVFNEYGQGIIAVSKALLLFNMRLIDAVCDIIPCIKPQAAYYEMYGIHGMSVLAETIKYAKEKEMLVILDGKRNDIGSTAESYAAAYLGETDLNGGMSMSAFPADALTVNAYLGEDGVRPFIQMCNSKDKGIFVLVKTSNPSSSQIQDMELKNGKKIYEVMAEYVDSWGKGKIGKSGYSNVGAVVGATHPAQAEEIRKILKSAYILVPGYGAQGGSADDAVKSFNQDGTGAIVNASRSLMCAYKSDRWKNTYSSENFDEATRAEALKMKEEINRALEKHCKRGASND